MIYLFVPVATQRSKKTERVSQTAMQAIKEELLDDSTTGETTSPTFMEELTLTMTVCSPRMLISTG